MKPIGEASGVVSPMLSIIEELCVFFNTISEISRLHVNNKGCFDTPSILISFRQRFLKPPDLFFFHESTHQPDEPFILCPV
jgi:hypothetical protein